jgi:uncharacterized protein (TIRG00374 family)
MRNKLFFELKGFYIKYRNVVSIFVLVVVLLFLFIYVSSRIEDFSLLLKISPEKLVLLFIASLIFRLSLGWNFKILMLFFNLRLVFNEWFGLTAISTMTNYLAPAKAGSAAQAVYLKKKHGLNYTHFISSLAGFFIISFLVNSVVGMFLSAAVMRNLPLLANKIFLFFFCAAIVILIPFILMRYANVNKIKWNLIVRLLEGLKKFHHQSRFLSLFIFSQLLVILAIGMRLFFAFSAIGLDINIASCIVIALVTSFSIFLSITPANLGIKEFFITGSSIAVGLTPAQGLMVALIDRAVDIIVSFVSGAFCSFILLKRESAVDSVRVLKT